MNKSRNLIIGLVLVSLFVVGVVAAAGSGFGTTSSWHPQQTASGSCDLYQRDADGDGILNADDTDWIRPMDGTGYGVGGGNGGNQLGDRPMDGTGHGARQGGGFHDGSCL